MYEHQQANYGDLYRQAQQQQQTNPYGGFGNLDPKVNALNRIATAIENLANACKSLMVPASAIDQEAEMAPRGYTLNKRTGKFQAPKAGSGTNNKTMAARNKTTALKRGKTAARRGK